MAEQMGFDFEEADNEGPKKEKVEKAMSKKAEAEYFADKRTPRSPMIAEAELAKMRELTGGKPIKTTSQASMISPGGNTTAAGRGGAGGGNGGAAEIKMLQNPKAMKKGGKITVSKASKRADGIAQRGKTRGKLR